MSKHVSLSSPAAVTPSYEASPSLLSSAFCCCDQAPRANHKAQGSSARSAVESATSALQCREQSQESLSGRSMGFREGSRTYFSEAGKHWC